MLRPVVYFVYVCVFCYTMFKIYFAITFIDNMSHDEQYVNFK